MISNGWKDLREGMVMSNISLYRLVGFVLAPFLILYLFWWSVGEEFNVFFIQLINSAFSTTILTLGIATLCSWWFCLTRSSRINISIYLTMILIVMCFIFQICMSIESIQPSGLYSPVAIFLKNGLESLTISLSVGFLLIIGMIIVKDSELEEE
jgi:hypothetical protein